MKHIQTNEELNEQIKKLVEDDIIKIEKKGTVIINGKEFVEFEVTWL